MFCTNCGHPLPKGARFCTECGSPVTESEAPVEMDPVSEGDPGERPERPEDTLKDPDGMRVKPDGAREDPDDMSEFPGDAPENESGTGEFIESETLRKRRILPIILGILIALVVAGIVGVMAYFHIVGRPSEQEPTVEEENRSETASAESETETGSIAETKAPVGEPQQLSIQIRQIENSAFPIVKFYANITDSSGETVRELSAEQFRVEEIQADGTSKPVDLQEVYQVLNSDKAYIDLVLDRSSSMDGGRMEQAKAAASTFLNNIRQGNSVEIISFDDNVYQNYPYSTDLEGGRAAISAITTRGTTALMDALYAGIFDTYYAGDGAKCVIGFTDGMENASNYTVNDVISLSQSTGIPVYLIGIGDSIDGGALADLAHRCSGEYYSASDRDLETELRNIYDRIYTEQQNDYVFTYQAPDESDTAAVRKISLTAKDDSGYIGTVTREYAPVTQTAIDRNFGIDKDQIIPDSSSRAITAADLNGLSLAELRIARNEIFARHGRMFKDILLNQWFLSKSWYLQIDTKYSPADYERLNPSPLSKLESANCNQIIAREKQITENEMIFPNAATVPLVTYDVALTKAVLKKALSQVETYPQSAVRDQNIEFIKSAIANANM
ncbi:Mg-chelatase subunit ChlD [[Clostridium] aminophilum]|uniref:Mg-chelatase subunit ChlD n=1 Tax=[Clostridium] aminophilum TaxID=1526 RepID=A0A1I0EK34_9FIRM|nr:YARHG domain-containing protein [[Clostridium] aminophilum]SET45543.1 Mg-chelatase subunit ChlD [[Clostridium] aminophilum]